MDADATSSDKRAAALLKDEKLIVKALKVAKVDLREGLALIGRPMPKKFKISKRLARRVLVPIFTLLAEAELATASERTKLAKRLSNLLVALSAFEAAGNGEVTTYGDNPQQDPCFREEENVKDLARQCREAAEQYEDCMDNLSGGDDEGSGSEQFDLSGGLDGLGGIGSAQTEDGDDGQPPTPTDFPCQDQYEAWTALGVEYQRAQQERDMCRQANPVGPS